MNAKKGSMGVETGTLEGKKSSWEGLDRNLLPLFLPL
jgi:hypothetical protein